MSLKLDARQTALLLLHFQKDICETGGIMAPDDAEAIDRFRAAISKTQNLLAAARNAHIPVVYSAFGRPANGSLANRFGRLYKWITESGGCVEGQPGYAFTEQLAPIGGEIVTRGIGISAFAGSTLGQELSGLGAVTLLVTGITTHWAVEATVRDAADRGHECIVVKDCVASASLATHEGALERMGFIALVEESEKVMRGFSTA